MKLNLNRLLAAVLTVVMICTILPMTVLSAAPASDSGDFRFADVQDSSAYYYAAVYWAYSHKPYQVTAGIDKTHFGPNKTVTRAQAMTFFWAVLDRPKFKTATTQFVDVKKTDWYYKPVMWAVENSVTAGTDAKHFSPNKTCNRGEVLTFLYAALKKPKVSISNPYKDISNQWYAKAALWAYSEGIEKGENGKFKASTPCTRAAVVTYLYRFETGYGPVCVGDHTWKKDSTFAPTCTAKGFDLYICSRCGLTKKVNQKAMLGHDFRFTKTVAPSTEAGGYDLYTCSRCGATEKRNQTEKLPEVINLQEVIDYGLAYAESLGYTIDFSLTPENSGYYPGYISNTQYFKETLEELLEMTRGLIDVTTDDLIALGDTIPGFRCNIYASYDKEYPGEYLIIFLYG